MARILLTLFILAAMTATSSAAAFTGRRGIGMDLWVTWPSEAQWSDPDRLFPFPEWQRTVGLPQLRSLKDNGFEFVRVPVDPLVFLSPKTRDVQDRLVAGIREAIDLVRSAGLGVIVDFHAIPKGGERSSGSSEILKDDAQFDQYLESLRTVAGILRDQDPAFVALELYNEPVVDCDEDGTNIWPGRALQAFAAARSSATKLTLILSGACWGSAEALARMDPAMFPDDNLIWSFHSYEPFLFSHQGASWTGDFSQYVYGLPFPWHEASEDERNASRDTIRERIRSSAPLQRQPGLLSYFDEMLASVDTKEKLDAAFAKPFAIVEAWAKLHAVKPEDIMLGEFGMIRQEYENPVVTPPAQRADFYKRQLEQAERRGYRWSMWSYGGAFGLVDAFGDQKSEPDVVNMVRSLPKR